MPSFAQLRATHATLLLIDASSSRVQVGAIGPGTKEAWQTSDAEAGIAVFTGVEKLAVDPVAVDAFVFCDGPGSILGIRTVAMAMRTWSVLKIRPIYAYSSLALVAHALGRAEAGIIADARRDAWHHYRLGEPLRRVAAAELQGELLMPENFRHWAPLPQNVGRTPYSVAELLPRANTADLFRATAEPDAFLHEEPSYVTWTPQIHRAP